MAKKQEEPTIQDLCAMLAAAHRAKRLTLDAIDQKLEEIWKAMPQDRQKEFYGQQEAYRKRILRLAGVWHMTG